MEIIENKALLVRVRAPGRITTVIPKSKDMGDGKVLVHWGLEEAQVLKNLRLKNVPSPILKKYSWPGLHKPFAHQKETAGFLTLNRRAFCLNEQGTGKTGAVIWAADYLMTLGKIRRVLIICPLSIMDTAWRSDLFKFAMHRTVDIAHSKKKGKRAEIINSEAEFVIINYDGVNIVADEIKKGGFDLIVVDEANAYKNAQTTRWKTLNKILTPDTWLWMLTGTPAAQSPLDAFGLAKLVNPKGVPIYFTSFKDMVMNKISTFKWIVKPGADKVVFDALQPAIRFTKEECLDLPEMTYVTRSVELTPQQAKFYDTLKKQLIIESVGTQITAVNAAVGLNKLLQISCGAVYTDSKDVLEFDISNRYKVLNEIIDETNHKVLIFVPFKHTIEILQQSLTADGFSVAVINGDVPVGKRNDIFRRFQTEADPRILIIQPQAASHGVTLVEADTVVWWGPTSSLETYAQANARIHRAGQKRPVTIFHLEGSNVEKHMYRMLQNRIVENGKLVDLYKRLLD